LEIYWKNKRRDKREEKRKRKEWRKRQEAIELTVMTEQITHSGN